VAPGSTPPLESNTDPDSVVFVLPWANAIELVHTSPAAMIVTNIRRTRDPRMGPFLPRAKHTRTHSIL
jgi:hypothetical protein